MDGQQPEGFIVGQRRICCARYFSVDGWLLIVWFNRHGQDFYGRTRHAEKGRSVITTKPGETLLQGLGSSWWRGWRVTASIG